MSSSTARYRRQYRHRSASVIIWSWAGALASLALVGPAYFMLSADLSGLRSCSVNNSGLTNSSCGKQSLNLGDFIIVILVLGVAVLAASAVTHAIRMTRRVK
ncbi:MAG: hypothetical protein ABI602_01810 [Candidatus Saccharibacteria bacterium]